MFFPSKLDDNQSIGDRKQHKEVCPGQGKCSKCKTWAATRHAGSTMILLLPRALPVQCGCQDPPFLLFCFFMGSRTGKVIYFVEFGHSGKFIFMRFGRKLFHFRTGHVVTLRRNRSPREQEIARTSHVPVAPVVRLSSSYPSAAVIAARSITGGSEWEFVETVRVSLRLRPTPTFTLRTVRNRLARVKVQDENRRANRGSVAHLGQMICMICMICPSYSHRMIYIFQGR